MVIKKDYNDEINLYNMAVRKWSITKEGIKVYYTDKAENISNFTLPYNGKFVKNVDEQYIRRKPYPRTLSSLLQFLSLQQVLKFPQRNRRPHEVPARYVAPILLISIGTFLNIPKHPDQS